MNRIRKLSLIIVFIGFCIISKTSLAEWKSWNNHTPDYPNTVAMDKFAALLKEKSDGKLTLKNFHLSVLGNQPDAIKQMRMGALQLANFSLGPLGKLVPEVNVVSLPFIFKNSEHMFRVLDGEVGNLINAAMAKKGIISLGFYDAGARSFYNDLKPIKKSEDIKEMKVRVMNNDIYADMISALGGNPSIVRDFREVYQLLKNKTIDMAENNIPTYESTDHFEVAKYYSLSEHLIVPECLCMNADAYNALSNTEKIIVHEAANESTKLQRELWAKRVILSRKKIEAKGVKVNEIKDKSAFQVSMKPVYTRYLKQNPKHMHLINLIMNTH